MSTRIESIDALFSLEGLDMLLAETGEVEEIEDKLSMYFQTLSQMERQFQTLVQEYENVDHELAGKMR